MSDAPSTQDFQHNKRWWVHFYCKTTIGQRTRYLRFEYLDELSIRHPLLSRRG
jgi:hypothetical protein